MYTSHGHLIPNTPGNDPRPERVARCGGINMCEVCRKEVADYLTSAVVGEHKNYPAVAIGLLTGYIEKKFANMSSVDKPDYSAYVVWFSKTLQNWKALLGTTMADDMYYEITYDGEKNRAYIDAYMKIDQEIVEF